MGYLQILHASEIFSPILTFLNPKHLILLHHSVVVHIQYAINDFLWVDAIFEEKPNDISLFQYPVKCHF
jgi:hypothetical protein